MPKIRNLSGGNVTVPSLAGRLVLEGGVVEVEAEQVYGFTQQSIWEPVDDEATKAHDDAHADYLKRLAADGQDVPEDAKPAKAAKKSPSKSSSNETPEV